MLSEAKWLFWSMAFWASLGFIAGCADPGASGRVDVGDPAGDTEIAQPAGDLAMHAVGVIERGLLEVTSANETFAFERLLESRAAKR